MDINVKVIDSKDPTQSNFSIHLSELDKTVGDIKKKIVDKLNLLPSNSVRLLFSGQFLSNDDQRIDDLDLGPSTFLNALIVDVTNHEGKRVQNSNSTETREWRSRFFVYCKNCSELMPGKLRVRCSVCKSTAILLRKEPNSWNDVLTRGAIQCRCLEKECVRVDDETSFPVAGFYFKCSECSLENGVVPLPQVKSFRGFMDRRHECSICSLDDVERSLMVVFSCDDAHCVCLDCFIAYSIEKLERRSFTMHPLYGYTLSCPEPRCRNGFITDAHHFRLLGDSILYEKYQRLATEIYLLGQGGVYCPRPDCGEAFIADMDDQSINNRRMILCPKCGWSFCFYCRSGASICHCENTEIRPNENKVNDLLASPESDELRSYVTIKCTTKSCPNCRAPTEKNEGCNHMTCGQCSFDWCWDCEKRWTDDCQWNHWFE